MRISCRTVPSAWVAATTIALGPARSVTGAVTSNDRCGARSVWAWISWPFTTIFARIESERVVAFLDACYSGAAGGRTFAAKRTRAGTVDDLFLERLTRSKGRAIVTASRPTEVSIELPDLGHGIFTYYLVQGLKGAADSNRDGIVTLQELYEYLEQQVTTKSRAVGGNQHPVMKGEMEGAFPLTKVAR